MRKDVDQHFKDRFVGSAMAEGYVAALLKIEGYWVLLSPDDDGVSKLADLYVRNLKGKTIAHAEVKSRSLVFKDAKSYPYDDALLATRGSYKAHADYLVLSASGTILVSPRGSKTRFVKIGRDNQRGVSGPVYAETRAGLITFNDYLDDLKRRSEEP